MYAVYLQLHYKFAGVDGLQLGKLHLIIYMKMETETSSESYTFLNQTMNNVIFVGF